MHNAAGMATPKPGEIRCPTCHRSTPPAAFCTQCGSAIPPDARARPRGMDRDELQERIRARRSGGEPYRRGGVAPDGPPGYERFEPEPDDDHARREAAPEERRHDYFDDRAPTAPIPPVPAPSAPADDRDLTRDDDDDWATAPAVSSTFGGTAPTAPEPPPSDTGPRSDAAAPDDRYAAAYDGDVEDGDDGEYAYDYDAWEPREERSGSNALAIVGFLALGVLALLGGALLAGVFGGGQTGQVDPTPTPVVSAAPSEEATAEPTPVPTESAPAPSGSAPASGGPIVFPDGFAAEAQPCLPGSASGNGCDSNAVSNSGSVWVWVGFENGSAADVVGARVVGPDGTTVGEGSIDLARIGCRQACNGWTYFPFSGLPDGTYDVEITRNGEPAATTSFEVS
jgi:hypothetical protein